MKKIFIKFTVLLFVLTQVSCGDHEDVIFDPNTGQTFISFADSGQLFSVSQNNPELATIEILSNTLSANTRTVQISVNEEESTAESNQYILSNGNISANEFSGSITVEGVLDNLTSQIKTVVMSLESIDENGATLSEETYTLRIRKVN